MPNGPHSRGHQGEDEKGADPRDKGELTSERPIEPAPIEQLGNRAGVDGSLSPNEKMARHVEAQPSVEHLAIDVPKHPMEIAR